MSTTLEPDVDLLEVVAAQVWATMLSADCVPWAGVLPADAPGPCARIGVTGEWDAEVLLATTQVGSHSLTRWLLRGDVVAPEDIADALGEVLNIVAGSLKSALGGTSQLGLPRVATESLADLISSPADPADSRLVVSWGGEPVLLAIRSASPERNTP